MRFTALLIVFFCINFSFSQATYKTLDSNILGRNCSLKILLPRGYKDNIEKTYPLILVLDGDYLFEPFSGAVDYLSYWDEIPEAIVVGIRHDKNRSADFMISEQNSLPIETGGRFFEFVSNELVGFLNKNYRLSGFNIIAGHGDSANFINYYLLRNKSVFNAYISISPKFATNMVEYLSELIEKTEEDFYYILGKAEDDQVSISKNTEKLFMAFNNRSYNKFIKITPTNTSYYTAAPLVAPQALNYIFKQYKPISKEEYKTEILTLTTSPVQYLEDKYEGILNIYGVKKRVLLNDIKAVAAAIGKTDKFEDYEALSKVVKKNYPETVLGTYYLAKYYEEKGEPKKAMRTYMSGFDLSPFGGVDSDLLMEKAEAIKIDFGY